MKGDGSNYADQNIHLNLIVPTPTPLPTATLHADPHRHSIAAADGYSHGYCCSNGYANPHKRANSVRIYPKIQEEQGRKKQVLAGDCPAKPAFTLDQNLSIPVKFWNHGDAIGRQAGSKFWSLPPYTAMGELPLAFLTM